ncbi:MAG: tetratricopeptide repeat protein [Aquificales bacterium]|nr:tetratricopeptide repeat protein [Aquificales bacterium]
MNKKFHHVQREALSIYFLITAPVLFFIARPDSKTTAIALAILFSVLLFINFILFNWRITLTDDAIIWQHFGRKKQFLYQDITSFKETPYDLGIKSGKQTIWITRQTGNYKELYRILKQKVPAMKQGIFVSFPWKINIRKGKIRRLIFTEDVISVQTQTSEKSYPLSAIKKIHLDGGLSGFIQFRGSALLALPIRSPSFNMTNFHNEYEAVIQLSPSPKITIDEQQAHSFGYTPEQFIDVLHRLYPHTAPAEKRETPSASWQIAQAHARFKIGENAAAIKLYEQGLATEKYDGLAWHRLGQCYLQLGAYGAAAKAFREAVTINFEDADSFYNGAIAYSQAGDRLMTRVYLEQALSLHPEWQERAKQNPFLHEFLPE